MPLLLLLVAFLLPFFLVRFLRARLYNAAVTDSFFYVFYMENTKIAMHHHLEVESLNIFSRALWDLIVMLMQIREKIDNEGKYGKVQMWTARTAAVAAAAAFRVLVDVRYVCNAATFPFYVSK